jgi:hypothetical protein
MQRCKRSRTHHRNRQRAHHRNRQRRQRSASVRLLTSSARAALPGTRKKARAPCRCACAHSRERAVETCTTHNENCEEAQLPRPSQARVRAPPRASHGARGPGALLHRLSVRGLLQHAQRNAADGASATPAGGRAAPPAADAGTCTRTRVHTRAHARVAPAVTPSPALWLTETARATLPAGAGRRDGRARLRQAPRPLGRHAEHQEGGGARARVARARGPAG